MLFFLFGLVLSIAVSCPCTKNEDSSWIRKQKWVWGVRLALSECVLVTRTSSSEPWETGNAFPPVRFKKAGVLWSKSSTYVQKLAPGTSFYSMFINRHCSLQKLANPSCSTWYYSISAHSSPVPRFSGSQLLLFCQCLSFIRSSSPLVKIPVLW